MHVFFSKKTLIVALFLALGSLAFWGAPANAATRTRVEATVRVYDSAGKIIVPEITLSADSKNVANAGLDIIGVNEGADVVPAAQGDLYLAVRGNAPYFVANGANQGGLYRLKKVSATAPLNKKFTENKKGVTYLRSGVFFAKDAIFAVYDTEAQTYFKIRVLSVKRTRVQDMVGTPSITTPRNDTAVPSFERDLVVTWKGVVGAEKYTLVLNCTSCGAGWETHHYEFDAATKQYVLPLSGFPAGKQYYNLSVQGVQGTLTTPRSSVVYFTYNNTSVSASVPTPAPTSSTSPVVTVPPTDQILKASTIVPPVVTGPVAGAVLGYYPRTVRATWMKVAGASAYMLSIECQSCGSTAGGWKELNSYTISNTAGNANSLDIPALALDSEYRIRMRSLDGVGAAGPWSDYTSFRFTTVSLSTPVISSPTANQTLTSNPRTFGVIWSAGANAVSYVVEVGCKNCSVPAWGRYEYFTTTDASNWMNDLTVATDDSYRVRVQAVDQYGNHSAWSEAVNFSFNTSAEVRIATPRINSPLTGSEVTGTNYKTSLSWSSVGNIYRYEVVLECNSCGTATGWKYVKTYQTVDTSNSILISLPQNGAYRFKVRAIDVDANRAGQWSDLSTFSFRTM